MARKDVSVVDAYIARFPPEVQAVLQRVRGIIRKALPGAEEAISYQIPTYELDGEYVVYFAGWKRHWSLYPVGETLRAALGPELASYEVAKGTVRFPLAGPVPARLVTRIVRELAKAAQARSRAKAPSARRAAVPRGRRARR